MIKKHLFEGVTSEAALEDFFNTLSSSTSIRRTSSACLKYLLEVFHTNHGLIWTRIDKKKVELLAWKGLKKADVSLSEGFFSLLPSAPEYIPADSVQFEIFKGTIYSLDFRHYKGIYVLPFLFEKTECIIALIVKTEPEVKIRQYSLLIGTLFYQAIIRLQQKKELSKLKKSIKQLKKVSQDVDKDKRQFISILSHELNTPLTSIIGFTELLFFEYGDQIPQESKQYLLHIRDAAKHHLKLINNLVTLARIETGLLRPHPMDVSFIGLIKQLTNSMETKYNKKLNIGIEIPPECEIVCMDSIMLRQILAQLLDNAFKFSEEGSDLSIGCKVSRNGKRSYLEITVSDKGMGVPHEESHKLFRPFSQTSNTMTRQYNGAGLGLYMCKKLTESMGGSVSYRENGKKGSTFVVRIPL